ncbi:hypothetical protein RNJ44_04154 [Nakaseomyces bracarensis]|uniref:Oxidoreductase-like domain-containing protein n=1 Tax=Nakaseomyces bracarensis TaxID=273131 RepID=A0ABR4NUA2_9SACH
MIRLVRVNPYMRNGVRYLSESKPKRMTFEGNTEGIAATPEERMHRIFGGRLKGEPPKSTSRILTGGTKEIAGVAVPEKPGQPDNCCMSGCVNCVWELYNDDVRYWNTKRNEAAKKINETDEIWPKDWNPPLDKLELKNVPHNLRTRKMEIDEALNKQKSVASLFPKRTTPLPKAVQEAKNRNLAKKQHDKSSSVKSSGFEADGWDDIPVYIKVFAEFERKRKLKKKHL